MKKTHFPSILIYIIPASERGPACRIPFWNSKLLAGRDHELRGYGDENDRAHANSRPLLFLSAVSQVKTLWKIQ